MYAYINRCVGKELTSGPGITPYTHKYVMRQFILQILPVLPVNLYAFGEVVL
jgi:hypothetical protein